MIELTPAPVIRNLADVPKAIQDFTRGSVGFVLDCPSVKPGDLESIATQSEEYHAATKPPIHATLKEAGVSVHLISRTVFRVPEETNDVGLHTDKQVAPYSTIDIIQVESGVLRWIGLPHRTETEVVTLFKMPKLVTTPRAIVGCDYNDPLVWQNLDDIYKGTTGCRAILRPGQAVVQPSSGEFGNVHDVRSIQRPRLSRLYAAPIDYPRPLLPGLVNDGARRT